MENTKEKNQLMDLYLSNIATAIQKIDTIKDVILSFNDKVYNARLVNKLEDVINAGATVKEHFYFNVDLNTSNLKMEMRFFNHRSIAGDTCWHYLPQGMESIDLIPYTPSKYNAYYNTEENTKYYKRQEDAYFYFDGKNLRINADYICSRLEDGRKDLEERRAKIMEDRKRVDEYEAERKKLNQQMRELQEGMCWECKSIYHMKDIDTFTLY